MSEEFKSYTVFPNGSYWIYEELGTGMIDSVSVLKTEKIMRKDDSYEFEWLVSSNLSSHLNDTVQRLGRPDFNYRIYVLEELRLSDFLNSPIIFFDTSAVGFSNGYAEDFQIKYESFYETLDIQSVAHKDVKVFHHNIQYFPYQSQRVFFARNVGIIKRELFNGEVWELKRYYVND